MLRSYAELSTMGFLYLEDSDFTVLMEREARECGKIVVGTVGGATAWLLGFSPPLPVAPGMEGPPFKSVSRQLSKFLKLSTLVGEKHFSVG